jgi:hypothetical protein
MNIDKTVKEKAQDVEMKLLKEIVNDDRLGLDDDNLFAKELYENII